MIKYTIYIPSKGRSRTCVTPKVLEREGIDFYIVVEPQDVDDYKQYFDEKKLLVLPENNGGMAYVRRFIKKYSTEKGEKYHWQIDDNIKGFRVRSNNKNVVSTAKYNLIRVENYINQYDNIGIAGLRHIAFAFAQKDDYTYNQQCPSCCLFNNDIKSYWREDVIEDTDFSLQVLTEGFSTIIFNRLVMDKMTIKALSGGCTDLYYTNDEIRNARQRRLQELWPGSFQIKIKNGISRVTPSKIWKTFKQKPIPKT